MGFGLQTSGQVTARLSYDTACSPDTPARVPRTRCTFFAVI